MWIITNGQYFFGSYSHLQFSYLLVFKVFLTNIWELSNIHVLSKMFPISTAPTTHAVCSLCFQYYFSEEILSLQHCQLHTASRYSYIESNQKTNQIRSRHLIILSHHVQILLTQWFLLGQVCEPDFLIHQNELCLRRDFACCSDKHLSSLPAVFQIWMYLSESELYTLSAVDLGPFTYDSLSSNHTDIVINMVQVSYLKYLFSILLQIR